MDRPLGMTDELETHYQAELYSVQSCSFLIQSLGHPERIRRKQWAVLE